MSAPASSFEVTYSSELVAAAAKMFRDYQFKRYGRLLLLCCAINALGFALVLWFGAPLDASMLFIAFVVVIGPVWLAYKYFAGPTIIAAKLRYVLAPAGCVTIGSASVSLPIRDGKQLELPWSRVKSVQEAESLFLLIVSPLWAYFLPKLAMPEALHEKLRARSRSDAA